MEKMGDIAVLLDLYGGLLTEKQRDVLDLYINYDLSLQEIAENGSISRQGVHDLIRRADRTLRDAEERLGFHKRLAAIETACAEAAALAASMNPGPQEKALMDKLKEIEQFTGTR